VRWTADDGDLPTDYRFTGQRLDSYINLYSMGARQYDPALGRWLSADAVVPRLDVPEAFNRFSYALGNPLAYLDPSGHLLWQLNYFGYSARAMLFSSRSFGYWMHGRQTVASNAGLIRGEVTADRQLTVAAFVSQQDSEMFGERAFGTDVFERLFVASGRSNKEVSRGIAQLTPSEMETYAPELAGADLWNHQNAIRGMAAKVDYIDQYISGAASANGGSISWTDRFMLLAICQNTGKVEDAQYRVDYYFQKGGKWADVFMERGDLQETLREVVVQIYWLLSQGWALPEGVDLEQMKRDAFADF
jgi:RHS repeat-associated protein